MRDAPRYIRPHVSSRSTLWDPNLRDPDNAVNRYFIEFAGDVGRDLKAAHTDAATMTPSFQ